MKPEVEQLTYPADLAESLDLDVAVGESGLTISGLASRILFRYFDIVVFSSSLI